MIHTSRLPGPACRATCKWQQTEAAGSHPSGGKLHLIAAFGLPAPAPHPPS
jgi:hypothetical protein